MQADVEQIKKDVDVLAEKLGIDSATVEKVFAKFLANSKKKGVPEEKLEKYAWTRVLASLKKKIIGGPRNLKTDSGFIMARSSAFDSSKTPRKTAQAYVDEHGVAAAISAGYAEKNTNPEETQQYNLLYKDFEWRMGKRIPEEDWQANGLAMIEVDGEVKVCDVRFKGDAAIQPVELFKVTTLQYFIRENKKASCDVTITTAPTSYQAQYVNLPDYVQYVAKVPEYKERILPNLLAVEAFYAANPDAFNRWCIVAGNVISINPNEEYNSIIIDIDDTSMSMDDEAWGGEEDDVPRMTIFFPDNISMDLQMGAIDVTFIVKPYTNKKGELKLSGMGYWVEDIFRGQDVEDEDFDVDEIWGGD